MAPRIDASGTVPLYAQVAASVEAEVEGSPGTWEYTPAEREYWLQKYADTEKPAVYGYAGGWTDILSCIDFLSLPSWPPAWRRPRCSPANTRNAPWG